MKCTRRWTNNWPHTLTSTCTMARPKCGIEVASNPMGSRMTRAARALKPEAVVWRGDPLLPVGLGHSHRGSQSACTSSSAFLLCPCVAPPEQTSGCVQSDQKTQKTLPDDMTCLGVPPRDFGHSTCVSRSACVVHLVIVNGRLPLHIGPVGQIPCEWSHRGTLGPPGC